MVNTLSVDSFKNPMIDGHMRPEEIVYKVTAVRTMHAPACTHNISDLRGIYYAIRKFHGNGITIHNIF